MRLDSETMSDPQVLQPAAGPQSLLNVSSLLYAEQVRPAMLVHSLYLYYKTDPQPLVMVLDVIQEGRHKLLRGVNLHYLPATVARRLVNEYCHRPELWTWDYAIDRRPALRSAFRSYIMTGMVKPRAMSWRSFLERLDAARNVHPADREALAQSAASQLFTHHIEPERVRMMIDAQYRRMARVAYEQPALPPQTARYAPPAPASAPSTAKESNDDTDGES